MVIFKSLSSKGGQNLVTKFAPLYFMRQRFLAIILIPLFIWILLEIIKLYKASSQYSIIFFLAHPFNFSLIAILILLSLYHGYLGTTNIIKDYIHSKVLRNFLDKTVFIICIMTACVSTVSFAFYHLLSRYFLIIS